MVLNETVTRTVSVSRKFLIRFRFDTVRFIILMKRSVSFGAVPQTVLRKEMDCARLSKFSSDRKARVAEEAAKVKLDKPSITSVELRRNMDQLVQHFVMDKVQQAIFPKVRALRYTVLSTPHPV